MNETEIAFYKSALLSQKSSILNRSTEFKHEQGEYREPISEDFEQAASDIANGISIHLHERDRSQLLQIERALSKLESGSFGVCEVCDEPIETGRLKARPTALLCLSCKEEEESKTRFLN